MTHPINLQTHRRFRMPDSQDPQAKPGMEDQIIGTRTIALVADRLTISSKESDYAVSADSKVDIQDFTAFPATPQPQHQRWFAGDEN